MGGENDDGEEAFDLASLRSPTAGAGHVSQLLQQQHMVEGDALSRRGSVVSMALGEQAPPWQILGEPSLLSLFNLSAGNANII